MKKVLLFAVALLCTISGFATDFTYQLSQATFANNQYEWDMKALNSGNDVKAKNGNLYVELPTGTQSGSIAFKCGSNKSDRFLYIYTAGTTKDSSRPIVMSNEYETIDFTADDVYDKDNNGNSWLRFSTSDDFKPTFCQLTASNKSAVTKYTVTYYNGTSVIGTEKVDSAAMPVKASVYDTIAHKSFDGWFADAALTTPVDPDTCHIYADKAFYGKFDNIGGVEQSSSVNIEQLVLDNGVKYNIKSALTAAKINYANVDALDSLNDLKASRNEPYLGLKIKKSDAYVEVGLKAGDVLRVKFGNVPDNIKLSIDGKDSVLSKANAASGIELTAAADEFVRFTTTSASTLVLKQIMINQPIAEVTLPAKTINSFTVSFYDGATLLGTETVDSTFKATTYATYQTKAGMEFKGWYAEAGLKTVVDITKAAIVKDTAFYAKFERPIPKYTVTYLFGTKVLGTEEVDSAAVAKKYGNYDELTGYKFKGWYLEPELTTIVKPDTIKINGNTSFYAKFEYILPQYTVTYYDGANTLGTEKVDSANIAKNASKYAKKDGFTFVGWYKEAALINAVSPDTTHIHANTGFYAKFQAPAPKYTVTYAYGSNTLGTETVDSAALPVKAADYATKAGMEFKGWFAEAALVTAINPDTTHIYADKTFYAKFEQKAVVQSSSLNIEQLIIDNDKSYNIVSALNAAKIAFENINALDSLDSSKTGNNEPYLGLKLKTAGAYVEMGLKAGDTLRVKFGHIEADLKLTIAGEERTLAVADATIYEYIASADAYVRIATTTAKTVVLKQIMINEPIAAVKEREDTALEAIFGASKATKLMINGQVYILKDNRLYNTLGQVVE